VSRPRFSLITATKNRTREPARLLASLDHQGNVDFELIFVDQNGDDRLRPTIEGNLQRERIHLIRCSEGVSLARNLGLEAAKGEILAFPDDDCWYPSGILQNVSDWFDSNPGYDILCVTSRDSNGERSGNRWHHSSCDLSLVNVFRTSVCYCCFLRSTAQVRGLRFDQMLGPGAGTSYLAAEDTDFILSAMAVGLRGRFEAKWHIGHPRRDVRNASISAERAYAYGLGMGRVQRKHRTTLLWAAFVFYDMLRAAIMAVLGRRTQATLWYAHGKGLAHAYRAR
jgi:glycosyltransferase involved in cell wall biosynthesis